MKKINIYIYTLLLASGFFIITSCSKEADNIFNMFDDVKVVFHGDHPFSVTDYKLVNDGDSVYVDYTITSANEDMYTVVEEKFGHTSSDGRNQLRITVDDEADRRSFSKQIKMKVQRDGKMSYRIYALNEAGEYIGDGYTKVTIEAAPSYVIHTNRRIYAADTLDMDRPSFYSIKQGQARSYNEGNANSTDIDFGIWRTPDTRAGQEGQMIYNYYSIKTSPNPFEPYDISDWDGTEIKFSNPVTGSTNNFLYSWVSGSIIEEQAKNRNLNVTSTNFSQWNQSLAPGNAVFFQTGEGKYGVFLVHAVTSDIDGRGFINVTMKVQK